MVNKKSDFEQKMTRINNSVVTIKNISDKDFTHSYSGVPYNIKAGETLPFIYPVGIMLAKHLAMRMIRDKAIKDGKMKKDSPTHNLYTKEALKPYTSKIVLDKEDKPLPAEQSEGEIMKAKTEEMQKQFKDKNEIVVTKRQVIEELRKREIRFNTRDTKEDLLKVLNEADMAGK